MIKVRKITRYGYLPVLIEPVIGLGLGVKRVTEVGWARRSDPVQGAVVEQEVVNKLLVSSLVVLLHDTEVSHGGSYIENRHDKNSVLVIKLLVASGESIFVRFRVVG